MTATNRCELETAFLRSIYSNPSEFTPRNALADWLEENGRADEAADWRDPELELDLEEARELWLDQRGEGEAVQVDGKFAGEESDYLRDLLVPYREWSYSETVDYGEDFGGQEIEHTESEGYLVHAYDAASRTLTIRSEDGRESFDLTYAADPLAEAEVVFLIGHGSGEYGWSHNYGQGEEIEGCGSEARDLLREFLELSRGAEGLIGLVSLPDTVSGEGENSDGWLGVADSAKWNRFLHFARRWESASERFESYDGEFLGADEVASLLYDKLAAEQAAD